MSLRNGGDRKGCAAPYIFGVCDWLRLDVDTSPRPDVRTSLAGAGERDGGSVVLWGSSDFSWEWEALVPCGDVDTSPMLP